MRKLATKTPNMIRRTARMKDYLNIRKNPILKIYNYESFMLFFIVDIYTKSTEKLTITR